MQSVCQDSTRSRSPLCLLTILAWIGGQAALAEPTGTAFTYRGQLKQNGIPLSGSVDLELGLFDVDTGGLPLGAQTFMDVEAVSGKFSVEVVFGASAFSGEPRWIETAIRVLHDPADLAPFTILEPRPRINSVPYATHALNAEDRSLLDALPGDPADAAIVDPNRRVRGGSDASLAGPQKWATPACDSRRGGKWLWIHCLFRYDPRLAVGPCVGENLNKYVGSQRTRPRHSERT